MNPNMQSTRTVVTRPRGALNAICPGVMRVPSLTYTQIMKPPNALSSASCFLRELLADPLAQRAHADFAAEEGLHQFACWLRAAGFEHFATVA
jgi:hypothetical protein